MGRDNVVDLATCYGLDAPGIKSLWGRVFLHSPRPTLGPTQPTVQWVPGLFPGPSVVLLPTPFSAEAKERGELFLFSLCAYVTCSRVNVTFLIIETTLTD